MRSSILALVAGFSVAGVVLTASLLHADGPRALAGGSPKAMSGPLSVQKKTELVNKTIQSLGATPIVSALPAAQSKVTPIAPVSVNAKIAYATPLAFHAPAPSFPDGAYVLDYGPNTKNEMRLELQTENGKLYLLDCKLAQFFGSTPLVVNFKRNGVAQTLNGEDGHYLFTFKSDKTQQSVTLTTEHSAGFYGCELTKIN